MLAIQQMREEITPLVRHYFTVPGTGMRFSAACFQGPGNDWSLGPLKEPADVVTNAPLVGKIRAAMRHLGADRIFAPSPAEFNGKIILPEQLSKVFNLGHKMFLFRNWQVPADGTFLRTSRDAGIFSAGGCSAIAVADGKRFIFAHAGRDCVIDRGRVMNENNMPTRRFESVVDSIINAFIEISGCVRDRYHPGNIHVWVLYSIRPEDFVHRYDDDKHGRYNKRVGADLVLRSLTSGVHPVGDQEGVQLDIPAIIRDQFMIHGVPRDQISLEHAYLSDELPHTRNGGGRYLAAVVRHS